MARFIREHARTPPAFVVRIKGTHKEMVVTELLKTHLANGSLRVQAHSVSRSASSAASAATTVVETAAHADVSGHHHDGDSSSSDDDSRRRPGRRRRDRGPRRSARRSEQQTTVTDFDFSIDIAKYISTDPELFVLADSLAAYRGQTTMEIGGPFRRQASSAEQGLLASLQDGEKERLRRGEAPWQLRNAGGSRSLEQWAEEYVRSEAQVKDFKFAKVVYGWDLAAVENAIRSSIASTLYSGKVEVSFASPSGNAIHVRPATAMSRMRANNFLRGALYATLVWPITAYFYEQQFRTCGAAYALKQWAHLPDSAPGDDVGSYAARTGRTVDPRRLRRTPEGISEARGLREGEWFAMWEDTIKGAVANRVKNPHPLIDPVGAPNSMASKLDGYPGQPGPSTSVLYQPL